MTTTKQRRVSFDDRDDRTDERHRTVERADRNDERPLGEAMEALGVDTGPAP